MGYQMKIIIYAFLLIVVGSLCVEWKAIGDFKDTFKEYSVALNTISSIENILNTSTIDSEKYLNKTFSDSPLWDRIAQIRFLKSKFVSNDPLVTDDVCFEKIISEDDFKLSYEIQIYQIQFPLRNRIVEISERLNNVSSALDIYQGFAESKYLSCKSLNEKCLEDTNEWLASTISSLSCVIHPNCSEHSIRKRSACSTDQFRCGKGDCIPGGNFCNGQCDCAGCDDEPSGCVKNCSEFRCISTFRCVRKTDMCNGINDCGDWSDEDGCKYITIRSPLQENCRMEAGDFLCNNTACVSLEKVCDGYNDCGDWSDEGDHCDGQCPLECDKIGGICLREPKGFKCLYECPPGTFETSKGCSPKPEAPLPSLVQILEDTPRLVTRYAERLKYLKIKSIMALSQSLREFVDCKKNVFPLMSKMIDFSTITHNNKNEPVVNITKQRQIQRRNKTTPKTLL